MSPRVAMIYGSLFDGSYGRAGESGSGGESGGGESGSWDGTLYNAGDEMTDVTGGWTGSKLNKRADCLSISAGSTYGGSGYAETVNTIDLTDWATVEANVSYNSGGGRIRLQVLDANRNLLGRVQSTGTGLKTLDISGISGACYVQIEIGNTAGVGSNPTLRFDNVKLGR